MKNLKTIEAKVKAILQKNEDARNDDMTLYLIVCNTYLKGAGAMPFAEVMEQYKYLGLPSFESVGRTRRKLQAKYPELAGNARVRRLRAEGEKAYRQYAKEEKRINGGYEIIESCTIGNNELVIGHNAKAPNPYVCWYCKDGSDYFWGYYCNQLSEAREKLNERYQRECRMPYNQPDKKQKSRDDRER